MRKWIVIIAAVMLMAATVSAQTSVLSLTTSKGMTVDDSTGQYRRYDTVLVNLPSVVKDYGDVDYLYPTLASIHDTSFNADTTMAVVYFSRRYHGPWVLFDTLKVPLAANASQPDTAVQFDRIAIDSTVVTQFNPFMRVIFITSYVVSDTTGAHRTWPNDINLVLMARDND